MKILRAGMKPKTLTLVACAALLAGCGGVTTFSGQAPVSVVGALPAPPPPPPPPPPPEKPPEPPPKVVVKDNKIEITEKIQFEVAKATILEASFPLLKEIADTIKKNPHIKKIAIEGHASSEGDKARNTKLSDERAKAVMKHLVEKGGVPAAALTAKGFGSSKPLADDTKAGPDQETNREKNRRVEFNIVEQDVTKKKVAVDATTGKETVLEEKTAAEKKEIEAAKDDAKAPKKGGLKKDDAKKDDAKKDDAKKDAADAAKK
jgi:outer membrane protein OmpA-like peptidoglycan-associated protein